ncbi:hypothetical protein ACFLW6_04330 [Chloroflexota bacterium]
MKPAEYFSNGRELEKSTKIKRKEKQMKKRTIISIFLALVMVFTLAGMALAEKPTLRGNDLPRGKSYNFNVIGVPGDSHYGWDDDSGGQGKRIFIDRDSAQTKFYVGAGTGFSIEDRNGLDGEVGEGTIVSGHLSNPGIVLPYDFSGNKWNCRVYVRLLGPPDASFKWKSEYYDGSFWLPLDEFTFYRDTKFAVPTGKILVDGFQDITWTWSEKNNFKVCQFRIFMGGPTGGYPPPDS